MSEQTSTFGTVENDTSTGPASAPVEPPKEAAPASILDEIVGSLENSEDDHLKIWEVPDRPGFELEFSTYLGSADFKRHQTAAQTGNRKTRRGRGAAESIDQFQLSLGLVRELSTRIIFQGQDVRQSDGQLMTLNSPEFLALIKRTKWGRDIATQAEAVEEFLTAGYLVQLGDSIITEAGYAGETAPVNR